MLQRQAFWSDLRSVSMHSFFIHHDYHQFTGRVLNEGDNNNEKKAPGCVYKGKTYDSGCSTSPPCHPVIFRALLFRASFAESAEVAKRSRVSFELCDSRSRRLRGSIAGRGKVHRSSPSPLSHLHPPTSFVSPRRLLF